MGIEIVRVSGVNTELRQKCLHVLPLWDGGLCESEPAGSTQNHKDLFISRFIAAQL